MSLICPPSLWTTVCCVYSCGSLRLITRRLYDKNPSGIFPTFVFTCTALLGKL